MPAHASAPRCSSASHQAPIATTNGEVPLAIGYVWLNAPSRYELIRPYS